MNARTKYVYDVNLGDETTAARVLRMVGKGKTVLEIGCASGTQTRVLACEMNCIVTAIEIDPDAAGYAREHCATLFVGDVESQGTLEQLGTRSFDVIIIADVLEHLRNPLAVLKSLKPHLKNGDGYVVASVPNIVHASVVYEMARGRFTYRREGLLDETHIRFFTRESALELFESAGFIVEAFERVLINPPATEFQTRPVTREDQAFLDYVLQNNPEARTYQFLIKAIPAGQIADQYSPAALRVQERISTLENAVETQKKHIRELESQLAWANRNRISRLLSGPKRLLSKIKGNA